MSSHDLTSGPASATRLRLATVAAAAVVLIVAVVAVTLGLNGGAGHAPALHASRPAVRAGSPRRATLVAEAPDPLAAQSFPDPAGAATHVRAAAPSLAGQGSISPGAPSSESVKQQLAQERALQRAMADGVHGGIVDPVSGAFTPANVVPPQIAQVIAAGNAIADFPYVYGGGHVSFVDRAYDCSGSVSYALAAAGLLGVPETSGQLEHWGAPGPGHYLTVFANAGHTFMSVDGVWFDTAGRAGPYSTRWLTAPPSVIGYVARHWPGL